MTHLFARLKGCAEDFFILFTPAVLVLLFKTYQRLHTKTKADEDGR